MSRNRKSKLIILIALVVSVCAMSIGFAAFSATLTISSSATVIPDDGGFAVTPRADGPFSVSFPDIKLEFTTDSTGYVEE